MCSRQFEITDTHKTVFDGNFVQTYHRHLSILCSPQNITKFIEVEQFFSLSRMNRYEMFAYQKMVPLFSVSVN